MKEIFSLYYVFIIYIIYINNQICNINCLFEKSQKSEKSENSNNSTNKSKLISSFLNKFSSSNNNNNLLKKFRFKNEMKNKHKALNSQVELLTKGVASLNIIPADDKGLIKIKITDNKDTYSFGLEDKKFKIKFNQDDEKLVFDSNENITIKSKFILLNTLQVYDQIHYKHAYNELVLINENSQKKKNSENKDKDENDKNNIELMNNPQGKYEYVRKQIVQSQWRMVILDNFYKNETNYGWNYSFNTKCGEYYYILGGIYQTSTKNLEKKIYKLPKHESVMIEFNAHLFGKWVGESMYAQVDVSELKEDPKYHWTYRCENKKTKNVRKNICADKENEEGIEYCKIGEKVSFSLKHSGNYIRIIVGSSLQTTPDEKAFGISDFRIYVK
jgi:hypothetical protein